MEPTGERFIPQCMEGQISVEHFSRYLFVSNYINLCGKTVLDIASGSGYGSSILAQKAKQVIGVDISQEAVDYANAHYANNNLTFQKGDCYQIPVSDKSIDLLVSFETIEHIEFHETFFSEIKRVLRPDGILVISSPNKRLYTDVPNRINPYHVKELYNEEIISLVSKYYNQIIYLGQNYLLTSVIYPIANYSHSTDRPSEYSSGGIVEKEPLYNIIIASDTPITDLKTFPSAFFYEDTVSIDSIYKEAYEEGMLSCHNTKAWKLGHFLLSPFRFFKRLFS